MIIFGFCWVLGEFVGARRAYHAEVERRLALLETERDQHARIAVAQERARIARELHDVLAHAARGGQRCRRWCWHTRPAWSAPGTPRATPQG